MSHIIQPYRFAAAGGAFDPEDLTSAGTDGWWKASDATVNGSNEVTAWADASSAGNDLTPSNTPTYTASAINGEPSVDFLRANSETFEATNTNSRDDEHVFIVAKTTSVGAFFGWVSNTESTNYMFGGESSGTTYRYVVHNAGGGDPDAIRNAGSITFGSFVILEYYRNSTDSVQGIRENGTQQGSEEAYTTYTRNGKIRLGREGFGNHCTASMAEIIAFDGELDSSDRTEVIDYLNDKYGLSAT